MTRYTIDTWIRRGCPAITAPRAAGQRSTVMFWMPDVVGWREKAIVAEGQSPAGVTVDLAELNRRIAATAAVEAEIGLAYEQGDLALLADWEESVASAFSRVSARLRSSAPKHAAHGLGVRSLEEGIVRHTPVIEALISEFQIEGSDEDPAEDSLLEAVA